MRFPEQLFRTLHLLRILQASRIPVAVPTLRIAVRNATEKQWCDRTIRRDLLFLEICGFVEPVEGRWKAIINPNFRPLQIIADDVPAGRFDEVRHALGSEVPA